MNFSPLSSINNLVKKEFILIKNTDACSELIECCGFKQFYCITLRMRNGVTRKMKYIITKGHNRRYWSTNIKFTKIQLLL